VLAVVVAKNLFVNVAMQMKRLDSNISAAKATLEKRPKVLQAVRVDPPIYVPFGMIHNVMNEVVADLVIADCIIRVNLLVILYVLQQDVLQRFAGDVRYNLSANLSQVTVQHSLNYSLSAGHSALLDKAQLAVLMHVFGKSADECFISFYFRIRPSQLGRGTEGPIVQSGPKALEHKPSGLLSDTKSAMNLHAGDAILAIDQHPESRHPLVEAERRIFEDRPDFQRELLIAATTEPYTARLDEVMFLGATPWASDFGVRPTEFNCVLESSLRIGEVNDRFW
jgi:hypothetical protein